MIMREIVDNKDNNMFMAVIVFSKMAAGDF